MTTSRTEHGRAAQKEECRPFNRRPIYHPERGQDSNRSTIASLAITLRYGQMQRVHGVKDPERGRRRRHPDRNNLQCPWIDPQSGIFSDRSGSIRWSFPLGEVTPVSTFLGLESLLRRPAGHRRICYRFPWQLGPARTHPRRRRDIQSPQSLELLPLSPIFDDNVAMDRVPAMDGVKMTTKHCGLRSNSAKLTMTINTTGLIH